MPDLLDGESTEMQGSGSRPYVLRNVGGVYSCSCPAWRNQSLPIESRTCKHLRKLRGEALEAARSGAALPAPTANGQAKPHAPPLLLAESWDGELNPTGWLISEKLDGVRAYWDGTLFLSRHGNEYRAPAWFTDGLPKFPLDGELWLGRKMFQRTVSIVRRHDEPDSWRQVRFVVFDAPDDRHGFERRLEIAKTVIRANHPPFAVLHEHVCCTGRQHVHRELTRVETLGGEGLMLRQSGSFYEARRSHTLQKVKRFRDSEARVVRHEPGKGRHRGRLGALLVELPNGTRFAVGSGLTDAQRESPPAIGSTITFRYQELTDGGVPRFPTFVRVSE